MYKRHINSIIIIIIIIIKIVTFFCLRLYKVMRSLWCGVAVLCYVMYRTDNLVSLPHACGVMNI